MKVRMSDMMWRISMVNGVNKVISDSGCLKKKGKILVDKLSYIEDKIKKAELSGKKRRSPKANEWFGRVNSFANEVSELRTKLLESEDDVVMFLFCGGLMPQLIETADTLVDQTPHLDELLIDVCETRGVAFLTTKMVGKAFEENFERIWRLLEVREVSSIGIYGMAGVGKTALAKCINNRLLEQSQSPVSVFWITVSREFTVGSLQEKIARLIGVSLLDDDDADIKAATLHRALSQMKNLVLILDDVWEYIDLLKVGCPVSAECCRLIITTRSLEVCRQILCQKVITVEKLREDEAWKLFTETLSTPGEEIKELSPHVEETAKSVARFCDGLPLGIITLAGSMRGEVSRHTWEHVLVELEEGSVMTYVCDTLKSSFDGLNNLSQNCFLSCLSHLKDGEKPTNQLVARFVSEVFSDERRLQAKLNQGRSILDKLVKVSLLESRIDSSGGEFIRMHNLVRVMALNVGGGRNMTSADAVDLDWNFTRTCGNC